MSIVQQCNADPCRDKLNLALGAYRTEVRAAIRAPPPRAACRRVARAAWRAPACLQV
jgi:hypothetical protein